MLLRHSFFSKPAKSSTAAQRFELRVNPCKGLVFAGLVLASGVGAAQQPVETPALLNAMTTELHRAFTSLGHAATEDPKQLAPYFLSYSVSDASYVGIRAQYGALVDSTSNHARVADVQVRLGDPKLDNTHGTHRSSAVNSMELPLNDDREAITRSLWLATNTGYGTALDNYLRVKTEAEVRAREEDSSPDFSQETAQTHLEKPAPPVALDKAAWETRVTELSKIFPTIPMCTRTW